MIDIVQAIILGIIQGITEWLPVSSSGHLALAEHLLGIQPSLLFNIALHIGSLVVILIVFRKEILAILTDVIKGNFSSPNAKLGGYIILGSIPTAIIGFTFRDLFASFFVNMKAIGIALIVTGILLAMTKRKPGKRKLNWIDSILVGIAQGCAIIPGISRSGATISTALLRGVDRQKAAAFSFLLAIPAIIGAGIGEFDLATLQAELWPTIIGTVTAIIVGYASLKLLLKIIHQQKFHLFSYYCFIVGIIVIATSL